MKMWILPMHRYYQENHPKSPVSVEVEDVVELVVEFDGVVAASCQNHELVPSHGLSVFLERLSSQLCY